MTQLNETEVIQYDSHGMQIYPGHPIKDGYYRNEDGSIFRNEGRATSWNTMRMFRIVTGYEETSGKFRICGQNTVTATMFRPDNYIGQRAHPF